MSPEEVEALKRNPAVRDAAALGLPDARFGERICAVVEFAYARPPELAAESRRSGRVDYVSCVRHKPALARAATPSLRPESGV